MEQEAQHIQNDWSALNWALGCVFASYLEITKTVDFFKGAARIFLATLILYFSCENFLGPVQALLCYLQLSKPALQLLAFFPIERTMCISWPALPMTVQLTSLVAGSLYVISAFELIRSGRRSIRWFVLAFVTGSIALVVEQGLQTIGNSQYLAPSLLKIVAGRAVFPILVAIGLWLNSANPVRVKSGTIF
ncbi:MAG TPA: hypothetical protein VNW15_08035 [Rhizomicrobium sp.]|nr:hypothetical protein [Rhizomicrobium sp.]